MQLWNSVCPCYTNTETFVKELIELRYEFYHSFDHFLTAGSGLSLDQLKMLLSQQAFIEVLAIRRDLMKP